MFFLLAVLPWTPVVEESVDLIEVNHYYDEWCELVFDQVIFYDWKKDHYEVVAWRLLKSSEQYPHLTRGVYVTIWHDKDVLRKITSFQVRETWTQYDPEIEERAKLSKNKRRELARISW